MKTKEEILSHLVNNEYNRDSFEAIQKLINEKFGIYSFAIKTNESGAEFGDFIKWLFNEKEGPKPKSEFWRDATCTISMGIKQPKAMDYTSKVVVDSLEEIISFLKEQESIPLHMVKVKSSLEVCIDAIKKNEGVD